MEKFTSSAFHCDNGQNERCVLLSQQSDLEDFNKFDSQDTIFQEYDPPSLTITTWIGRDLDPKNGGFHFGRL